MNDEEKPFWLNPPYLVLFDLIRLHRLKPWDIDLTRILEAFMKEMLLKGYVDFSASGTALLSSTMIHKMKTDLLLRMEEPPEKKIEKPNEPIPPPLPMPLRLQYTATSISEIVDALLSTLEREKAVISKRPIVNLEPIDSPKLDEFFIDIEDKIDSLYTSLKRYGKQRKGAISFLEYNSGLSVLNMVRNFILLLFLVTQEKLRIEQEEGEEDIRILLI